MPVDTLLVAIGGDAIQDSGVIVGEAQLRPARADVAYASRLTTRTLCRHYNLKIPIQTVFACARFRSRPIRRGTAEKYKQSNGDKHAPMTLL